MDGEAQQDDQTDQLAAMLLLQDETPLYSFVPQISATFFWPLSRGWITQAILDLPHLLLLPFKLLAVLLAPVLWCGHCSRARAEVRREAERRVVSGQR